jgi:hypothetical protein
MANASTPIGTRIKAICGKCPRTVGDLLQQDGYAVVVPRLKGRKENHAVRHDGPIIEGTTRSGRPTSVRSVAATSVVCRCGADIRLHHERAQALLLHAYQYGLPDVRLFAGSRR